MFKINDIVNFKTNTDVDYIIIKITEYNGVIIYTIHNLLEYNSLSVDLYQNKSYNSLESVLQYNVNFIRKKKLIQPQGACRLWCKSPYLLLFIGCYLIQLNCAKRLFGGCQIYLRWTLIIFCRL